MTFAPVDSKNSFLPTTLILPDPSNTQEFKTVLTDFIKKTIAAVNAKDIAQYVLNEIQNGQVFFHPTRTNTFRSIYRKVIDFGALPNNTTKEVNHEIEITDSTRFTRIYGVANDPSNSFIPLPYSSGSNPIEVEITTTDVRIITTFDYSGYTDTFIILEYLKF